ncbi:MAG: small-conductance mechanosensitive channel [Candidatus Krumholzibacteriia bacterium]|jgi:small-conductance mechanosensitive channel
MTGWSAYLGLVSAGLAISLQAPLSNLAGWVFISIRKPFTVGDRIEIGGHPGHITILAGPLFETNLRLAACTQSLSHLYNVG